MFEFSSSAIRKEHICPKSSFHNPEKKRETTAQHNMVASLKAVPRVFPLSCFVMQEREETIESASRTGSS